MKKIGKIFGVDRVESEMVPDGKVWFLDKKGVEELGRVEEEVERMATLGIEKINEIFSKVADEEIEKKVKERIREEDREIWGDGYEIAKENAERMDPEVRRKWLEGDWATENEEVKGDADDKRK